MATIRVHEDQENRMAEVRRGKENMTNRDVHNQTQGIQQQKRAVLGLLHNNYHRSKSELQSKDEKFSKAKIYVPASFDTFNVYEDNKDDKEAPFKIYEEKLEEEKSVVLRETRDTRQQAKQASEVVTITAEREMPEKSIVPVYRSALQEVVEPKDEIEYHPMSPMSLEKSILLSFNEKNENKAKLDITKITQSNYFDVDEYRADIYHYLRQAEKKHRPKPGYMKKQPDITYAMRTILIDWLVEVSEEYKLQTETLYLAVSYIDRFLSYMSVVRAKLQLVGTAAMFIAAKYEEIYPPDVGEFVYITDDTYTKKQVLRMEHLILRVLSFDLTVPTPLVFLRDYCISNNLSDRICYMAMYLCELSMLEADPYLQFLPSLLAASAIAVARHTLQEETWPHELELSTGYNLKDLRKCIKCLCETFANAPNLPQQAIQDKYKTSKYGHVALLLPRSTDVLAAYDDDESA